MQSFDTLVVSDLHLGAHNARTDDFLHFLDSIDTRRLVLAGDVFDDPSMGRMKAGDLRVLDALRQFGESADVVWIRGNHDPDSQRCRATLGFDLLDECLIDVGDEQYLVQHGHAWDASMSWPKWIIRSADAVYHFSQWIDPTHKLAKTLKRRCKKFCRAIDNLQKHAIAEAHRRQVAGVILGHSHVSRDLRIDGVHYLNSGCWTEKPSSFVGVRDGVARRVYWDSLRRRQIVANARTTRRQQPLALVTA